MGIKRRRGRLVLFLLGAIAIGAATAAVVRRRLAGPTPFPPGPVMPNAQSAPPPPPPPPPPPVQPSFAHAPDVVSDPEMDPSSEGGPALSQDQANTFFDQVMAETASENPEPEAPTR